MKSLLTITLFFICYTVTSQTFPGGIKPLSSIEAVKETIPIESYPYNYYMEGKGEAKAKGSVKLDEVYYTVSFEFNDKKLIRMNLSFEESDYQKVVSSLEKKYKLSPWTKTDAKCYKAKNIMILVNNGHMACYYESVLTF